MIQLPSSIERILDYLNNAGYKAYAVGGCVRDTFMGKTPHDWDITTEASPEQIKEVFSDFRTIDTGIKHGTVTVICEHTPVEITTFRIDGEYTDNRHPDSVKFTKDVKEDLARRDFTVNAIAYNPQEGVIDPFGGIEDIKKGIIRCVGSPDKRFNEDALRILRAIRFASTLGFEIEKTTSESIIQNENLISGIAVERISAELIKLLTGKNVHHVLLNYKSVLAVFIPELKMQFGFKQYGKKHAYDVWGHTALTVANIENDPILRLTMLLHDTGKVATHALNEQGNSTFKNHAAVGGVIAENILRRLKMSNEYIRTVSYLVSIHDKDVPETKIQVKKYLRDMGEENFIRLMKIRRADRSALSKEFRDISAELAFAYSAFSEVITNNEPYTLSQLTIKGSDIKKMFRPEEIGEKLNALLDFVIREPEHNNKQDLLEKAKTY
ncbi:MAG: CCA tRNA nucleotidyltransferase [Clostridia bacterium]|nr:CCA tRNA nucleotidyltransferase [Clostridia bacterium]